MWVKDQQGLIDLCAKLEPHSAVMLDTEFAPERRYFPRFDLLQVATVELAAAIDVRTGIDLSPLLRLLNTPDRTVVVHSGLQDMNLLFQRTGTVPRCIFDTQLAAAFLGYGSHISFSSLVKQIAQVDLPKTETLTDWSRRPLRPEQLEYALDDVRYLVPLHVALHEALDKADRFSWFQTESDRIYAPANFSPSTPTERWRKIPGWNALDALHLSVLIELVNWRERFARTKDQPPRALLSDDIVLHIAKRAPRTLDALRENRQLFERTIEQSGHDILKAVRDGLEASNEQLMAIESSLASAPSIPGLLPFLESIIEVCATNYAISSHLLANRDDLVRLSSSLQPEPSDLALFSGWRRMVAGDAVIAALHGNLTVQYVTGELRLMRTDLQAE